MTKALHPAGSRWLIGLCAAIASFAAPAQPADADWAELQAAVGAANKAMVAGPADIKLVDQAVLKLPKALSYLPAAEARRLAAAMGNRTGEGLLGMVLSSTADADWFIVMRFARSGYIKDDDAKGWKAGEVLADLKKGMEEANKERRARGISGIEAVDWIEAPKYDAATHRLFWLLESKDKGAPDEAWGRVNYNMYALGRDGYISMHFATKMEQIEAGKPIMRTLLAALQYHDGKGYGDFNPATDPVAEYGLAALVSGIAAQKPGFFALIFAFILKFGKVIGVAALGVAAVLLTVFKIRQEAAAAAVPASTSAPPQA